MISLCNACGLLRSVSKLMPASADGCPVRVCRDVAACRARTDRQRRRVFISASVAEQTERWAEYPGTSKGKKKREVI